MNFESKQRQTLSNFKKYECTLTSSYETYHGISGHLFEIIEYFYYFTFFKKIKTNILISDGLPEEVFWNVINEKYNFSNEELEEYKLNTFFHFRPKAILANNLFIVDGSLRVRNASILAKNIFMFRCNEDCTNYKNVIILQDYDVYAPLENSIDYKKKILLDKYKTIKETNNNIAMFYATSNSRALSGEEIKEIIKEFPEFDEYLILSNKYFDVPEKCRVELVPIKNLWESFSTYIYTNASSLIDCSPRFIVECKHFNKEVIFCTRGKKDKGLEVRMKDMEKIDLNLKEDNDIFAKIEHTWYKAR